MLFEAVMAAGPQAPALARRAIRGTLEGRVAPESVMDALIVASEMVAYRIRRGHLTARRPIHLIVRLGRLLVISVEDTGTPFRTGLGADDDAQVLEALLARLSSRWGAGGGYRPTLWAELAPRRLPFEPGAAPQGR